MNEETTIEGTLSIGPVPGQKSECVPFGYPAADSISFRFAHPKPNWWWRLWQYLLLGWRWRDLPEAKRPVATITGVIDLREKVPSGGKFVGPETKDMTDADVDARRDGGEG